MIQLAGIISEKLNRSQGPTNVVIPMGGFSEADAVGGPLWDPKANQAFISELKTRLASKVEVTEVNAHINDTDFAEAVVNILASMVR